MPKVGQPDPHMKSPWPKIILFVAIAAALVFLLWPEIKDVWNENFNSFDQRAANS